LLNTSINEGSIHLTSLLGMGAYGVVFLGIRTNTSRRCAVKLLSESDAAKNEIKLHKRVSGHPGILPLEEIIREKGHVFLVLEYAPEGDLFSAITQKQGIVGNDRAIRSIFLQILDAVQHCHDHGVAHRDLKPENILMFPHRSVKIADFGLATGQSVSSEFGCGSSFYFSPECQGQALGHSRVVKGYSTRQNDVWSLGVILVNLVVGRNPWHQATLKDTAFAIYCRKPNQAFFKHILPSISDALADLLVRIFTLDPGRRISLPELRVRVTVMESFVAS
ncbi:kinase-like domain-containing protein, partial [Dichotomocladium elegans]